MKHLADWLIYIQHNRGLAPKTAGEYRRCLLRFAEWAQAQGVEPQQAGTEQIQRYCGEVLHSKGLSPDSRRVSVSAVRGFFRWLFERRVIAANPAASLPFPRRARKLPIPISPDECSRLMAEVDLHEFKGVRDLAIISLLIGCGPRVSGICHLNDDDLMFHSTAQGLEELTVRFTEKGKHERYVPAPEEARLMLRAYLGHPDLERIDRRTEAGRQVLFVNLANSRVPAHEHRGEARRITEWSVYKMIQGYGQVASIDRRRLHPHAFRHLYGQELAEGDTHILVMQQLMGHRKPESTEIYSHIAFRKMREAAMKSNPMKRVKHPAAGLAAMMKGR